MARNTKSRPKNCFFMIFTPSSSRKICHGTQHPENRIAGAPAPDRAGRGSQARRPGEDAAARSAGTRLPDPRLPHRPASRDQPGALHADHERHGDREGHRALQPVRAPHAAVLRPLPHRLHPERQGVRREQARAAGRGLRAAPAAAGAPHRPDLAGHHGLDRRQGLRRHDRGAAPVHDDARRREAELDHAHLVGARRVPRPPRDARGVPVFGRKAIKIGVRPRFSGGGSMLKTLMLALCLVAAGPQSLAQDYPSRVIRIVNPFAAGGPSELVARDLAGGLAAHFGQQVIVESRPGGGTVIGADHVAKSPPDGYTLLLASASSLIVAPLINASLPYDARKDFAPVGMFATVPNLIAVHPSLPVSSVKELIDYARRQPGKLNYASAGTGTGPHLAGELFKSMAQVDLVHVPFKGAAPAVPELLAGRVEVSFLNLSPQMPHVK